MIKTSIKVYNILRNKVSEICQKLNIKENENNKGRKSLINKIDSLALATFKQIHGIATKKSLFEIVAPKCSYKTLVVSINKCLKLFEKVIKYILGINRKNCHLIKHTDSTDLPVCSLRKSKRHKTMKGLASWSKSSKGWFYGLKLHLSADLEGRFVGLRITTGKAVEREAFKIMNKNLRGIFVTDAGYVSKKLEREFHIEKERMLLTCSRSNMKKVATFDDIELLKTRMRIEDNFGNMKQYHNLVSTVCRSIQGYLVNYLSSIFSYMIA